ncbi:isoprenylcysteine carboxylmethyltransferase family protein [Halobacteriovorax sp. GB3]|uniref:isoprenylcysteine carboxyl methyltransferase family protein n=1 Tax=Halobacteriovorax sp. GB3 TaxID=2719615 RepID=UPI002362D4E2|nr:isoprenylcysteine carboxylmethyltransferase family protein [Halobacteriovorax sp. GB3]MDD0852929.1 isoprenylcysteine carboxylmethyltransferase family protein [Halobacteriovorax sp. GB3]
MIVLFYVIFLATVIQRLFELRLSKKNEKSMIASGGEVIYKKDIPFMMALHTLWFVSLLVEFNMKVVQFDIVIFAPFIFFFFLGQLFRYLAITELKGRWCTKVIDMKGAMPIASGVYKVIRHPNYLGVILEFVALPLAFELYFTAGVFSLLNLFFVFHRISVENKLYYERASLYNGKGNPS